jgi:hypothetical protein
MTLFHPGDAGGNFVMVEPENDIRGFETEVANLMSVLAP